MRIGTGMVRHAEHTPAEHALIAIGHDVTQDPNAISTGSQRKARRSGELRSSGHARARLIAGLIIVLGLAASTLLAVEWRSNALNANRKSFSSMVADLSGALDSKLDTSIGLTRTMRAIATMEPNAGETRFLRWHQQLQSGAAAPQDVVAALIQTVPASHLSAFQRQANADAEFRALLGGWSHVVPAGRRPVYCLTRAAVGRAAGTTLYPPSLDYCAPVLPGIGRNPYADLARTVRDTGTFIVTPLPGVSGSLAAIGAAVYRRGAPLASVSARRAALTGFVGTTFDSPALIRPLLVGHRSLSLALYHKNVGAPLQLIGSGGAGSGGRSPGYSERRGLGEGWLVVATGLADRSVSANAQGLFVLGLGVLVTVLVLLLDLVLSRSRRRALGLVDEKTVELEYSALHDPLTDLPNRGLVLDRAEQLLGRARRLDVPVTALFMDIDGFKQINDGFGHQVGDEILRQVGARLKTALRASDTVGRLGGDEFVMLVDSVGVDVGPEFVAERILDVLRQPIEPPGSPNSLISVTASIGIATGLPASAEDLLQDAELALYKAKAEGKDGYAQFESAMQTAARDRIHLEMDLAKALDADELFLVYQPMLDLENERVVGVEALLRWSHPTRGVIGPDVFVPIAEENGLIVPIGRWVLEQACAQGAAWHQNGYALNISVNVSARQLERTALVHEVGSMLDGSGLDPESLTIEMTETALMSNPEATAHLLAELKALGVRVAVDDFGTGYSSLAYLRQFPVDLLKIDRTFITDMELSRDALALTQALIELGKTLGLQTLAEGVERHNQVQQLRREGCDLAQGFLFARPLKGEEVESFVARKQVADEHHRLHGW
jgi:diguanylate cyclase (GGDEF)-like protein